ncbi:unnamed protein product, partial [Mesorhabditis belari]|uniref:Innexin n=1 Tax=Mesorhabditis belari TaxID=2138241 RepID=A0AAF3FHW9_9BILA
MFIFRVLNTVPYSNEVAVKDVIAHIHSFFTCNLLIGLAVLVSWKQFGGKPIECMVPTDFTPAWVQYAENFCWAQDTYFVPLSEHVPTNETIRKSAPKISYYQWMPFFLLFNAACFKMPCFIWKYFASQSGMRVGEILRTASDDENAVPETKKGNIEALCTHLQGGLRFHKRLHKRKILPHKVLRFLNLKYSTYYVTFIYFMAKIAFLLNVGVQTKLLNRYVLPEQTSSMGWDVWRTLAFSENHTLHEDGIFPRVSLCDFEVRETGNVQTHTVQCVLIINIFTEKIFIVLWAWYLILGAFTAGNLFSWFFIMFSETSKEHFVISHLEMAEKEFDKETIQNRTKIDNFINEYLGMDGIFLLQLIAQHADVVFITELVGALFSKHDEIERQRQAIKQMNKMLPPTKTSLEGTPAETSRVNSRQGNRRDSYVPGKAMLTKNDSLSHATSGVTRRNASLEDLDIVTGKNFEDSSDEEDKKESKNSKRKESAQEVEYHHHLNRNKPRNPLAPHESRDAELRKALFWASHSGDPNRSDPFPHPAYSRFHGAYDKDKRNHK